MGDDLSATAKTIKRIVLTGLFRQQQADIMQSTDSFRAMLDDPELTEKFDAESITALRDWLRTQEFYHTELVRITRTLEIK